MTPHPDPAPELGAFDCTPLVEAAKKATPGPWRAFISGGTVEVQGDGRRNEICHWVGFDAAPQPLPQKKRNARFIAAANPSTILALCADLDRAIALLTSLDAAREAGRVAGVREAAETVKCSCSGADAVIAAALKEGPNSGPRWMHCGENNCGALLAADILSLLPKEPPQ